ncbi:UDP-N-acetylglucosamine 2-epimerase (non-hydrolyzing) [Alphaproteobacteria bacterium]|nr:UDP-N-acetylglucosamine 2-epimerase (non-hydrolyzing) [Alphaproteobacteria bacterium]
MKKVLVVFGTRPEAIKLAPLVYELRKNSDCFNVKVCVTAQHRQMLDQVLNIFKIDPDNDLNIMKVDQNLFDVTAEILLGMQEVFKENRPDLVLVHGDTTTALASSLAAFYTDIPVCHVEAGLRTFDLNAPFPEEFNRQIVSKIAKWHFAPTKLSKKNLMNENISEDRIIVTGNTVVDALYFILERISEDTTRRAQIEVGLDACLNFDWRSDRFVLITGHRRENFGFGFNQICSAIKRLAIKFPKVNLVYPVHLNPNVRQPVKELLSHFDNIFLTEPLDYEPFVYLLKHSYLVLTDSGGIQEEAPSLGKPVLVMRDVTERPEAIEAGTVELVGANEEKIVTGVSKLLEDTSVYLRMSRAHNPYGDGSASARIVNVLKSM